MEEMNYNKLREIQRMVRSSVDIVELPVTFYNSVQEYLKTLEKRTRELNQTTSVFAEDARTQIVSELNNARKIVIDIFDRRERKIVLKALSSARTRSTQVPKNLLAFEEERYQTLLAHILEPRQALLEPVLNGKTHESQQLSEQHTPQTRELEPPREPASLRKEDTQTRAQNPPEQSEQKGLKTLPLLISEDIPTPFVWEDGNTYGPFEKNTHAVLPFDLAMFLIQNNKARKHESSSVNETVLSNVQDTRRAESSESESASKESSGQDRTDSFSEDSEGVRFNTLSAAAKKQTPQEETFQETRYSF